MTKCLRSEALASHIFVKDTVQKDRTKRCSLERVVSVPNTTVQPLAYLSLIVGTVETFS